MMTLAELKKLHQYIKKILAECSNQDEDLLTIQIALIEKFEVTTLNDLPTTVLKAYKDYKYSFLILQSLSEQIQAFINTHVKNNNLDNSPVKWEYFPDPVDSEDAKMAEIVRGYELLRRRHIDFKFYCQSTEKNKNFQDKLVFDKDKERHINLSSSDFSDEFTTLVCQSLQGILDAVSGKFDCNNIDKQLSSLGLATLDEKLLPLNYAKDSYTTYFDDQCIHLPIRETHNTPEHNKKAEDFVNAYLKKSGLPLTMESNLKVLFTTLTNQGTLAYAACLVFGRSFWIHGNRICNFGQDYRTHISFDEKNQIKIQIVIDQNKYNLLTGQTIEVVCSIIKMEFTMAVNVANDTPYFTLINHSIACSLITPLEYPMTIAKAALKNSQGISPNKFDALATSIGYIAKFLGYNSLSSCYIAKGQPLTSRQDKEAFQAADFFTLLDVAYKNSGGRKLSKKEYEFFFKDIANAYVKGNLNAAQISAQICKFVSIQIQDPNLNSSDKLRYMYWLQLARELKGSENFKDEIHKIYISLVDQFTSKEPVLLAKAAEDDAELYQGIVNPSSFFTKKASLSDDYHAKMLAKYPLILQGSNGADFVKILNGLNPQAKLLFLVALVENEGDIICFTNLANNFFDKKMMEHLSIAVQKHNLEILELWNTLIKKAPAASVAYLRKPFADVFEAYNARILKQSPRDLLHFLKGIVDKKLVERFGLGFLDQLVIKVAQMAIVETVENLPAVFDITSELGEMLGTEINLVTEEFKNSILRDLNSACKKANARLLEMNPQNPADQMEKASEHSTSDDEILESLTTEKDKEKERTELDNAEKKIKSSVQKLTQEEKKPVISEKNPILNQGSVKDKLVVSSDLPNKELNF